MLNQELVPHSTALQVPCHHSRLNSILMPAAVPTVMERGSCRTRRMSSDTRLGCLYSICNDFFLGGGGRDEGWEPDWTSPYKSGPLDFSTTRVLTDQFSHASGDSAGLGLKFCVCACREGCYWLTLHLKRKDWIPYTKSVFKNTKIKRSCSCTSASQCWSYLIDWNMLYQNFYTAEIEKNIRAECTLKLTSAIYFWKQLKIV